jgi:hypothetical protein
MAHQSPNVNKGVCHKVALPFRLKSIFLRQKKNYRRIMEKLKYFTMQKYNLSKNPLKETKNLQDVITL